MDGDELVPLSEWEVRWAPYDDEIYERVLSWVRPTDVVVDIGAGDLRLARRMAAICQKVYAIELQASLIEQAQAASPLPPNLEVWIGDARVLPFPSGVTLGVLLMRHTQHTGLYMQKLRASGARGLITNARWHLDVEWVDLQTPRLPFEAVTRGWYACRCGNVGFIPAPPEEIEATILDVVHEVAYCPACERR